MPEINSSVRPANFFHLQLRVHFGVRANAQQTTINPSPDERRRLNSSRPLLRTRVARRAQQTEAFNRLETIIVVNGDGSSVHVF